jgi:hypothetical protein
MNRVIDDPVTLARDKVKYAHMDPRGSQYRRVWRPKDLPIVLVEMQEDAESDSDSMLKQLTREQRNFSFGRCSYFEELVHEDVSLTPNQDE